MQVLRPLVDLVSRMPTRVQVKLMAAFLAIVVLLIAMGAVGLKVLSGVNQRTDELNRLQRKIEAYRQVQHDITSQLYSVSSAFLSPDDVTLSSTLRQLNQFGYNIDLLDETRLFGRIILRMKLCDEQVQGMEGLPQIMACCRQKARLGEVCRLQLLIEVPQFR